MYAHKNLDLIGASVGLAEAALFFFDYRWRAGSRLIKPLRGEGFVYWYKWGSGLLWFIWNRDGV